MKNTFWSVYEPPPDIDVAIYRLAHQKNMENYHAKLSQWLLQAEEDVIVNFSDQIWSSDDRLSCICAAMTMCLRAIAADVPTAELQPDGLLLAWDGTQFKADYTAAGINSANQILSLLEDDWQSREQTFRSFRIVMSKNDKTDEELRTLVADIANRARNARLIDGIDRFCGHDTDWPIFRPTSS